MSKVVSLFVAATALFWTFEKPAQAADDGCKPTHRSANVPTKVIKDAAPTRLFERSVEPANDRAPRLARASGELAMKALAAPGRLAQWLKSRPSESAPPSD